MNKKILIADDEVDIIQMIKYRLIKEGYELIIVNNGQEAVNATHLHKPDLIIIDYRMPVMNGLDAIKMIKTQEPFKAVPVIMLTASSASLTIEMVKQAGIAELISKPFEAEELMNTIKRYIR